MKRQGYIKKNIAERISICEPECCRIFWAKQDVTDLFSFSEDKVKKGRNNVNML
jgi:hypothetical protein